MRLKPTENKVIILADSASSTTEHGLVIPDDSKEKPMLGTVMGAGPDCKQLKEGDRVIFPSMYGSKFTEHGKEYNIMKEGDVFVQLTIEEKIRYASWEEILK